MQLDFFRWEFTIDESGGIRLELNLLRAADTQIIKDWLFTFLKEHLTWWSNSYSLNWDDSRIESHIKNNKLADNAFDFISNASKNDTDFVRTLKISNHIAGVVHAQVATNKLIKLQIGRIQWIWIEPQNRGSGYGKMLIREAHKWLSDMQIAGAELFVNSTNHSAVSLYQSLGYEISDYQMLISKDTL